MIRRLIPLTVLVVFAAMAALACGGDEEQAPAAPRPSPPPPPSASAPAAPLPPAPTGPGPGSGTGPVTEVEVQLRDSGGRGPFAFGPADLSFSVGEVASFTFIGESQFHTFTVEELGIDVDVDGGETVSFDYTFDEPGTYTLICIPHQALGMVGTITVGPSTGGAAPAPLPPAPAAATAKTVNLDDAGGRGPFSFDPAELTFNAGETVDFTFVGESQFHTFTVADLGIDVDVDGGETVTLQYTFDTPGTYELIFVPHQALGMVGTITVR